MKELFNDWDIRRYTFTDKLNWIFDALLIHLKPCFVRNQVRPVSKKVDGYQFKGKKESLQIAVCTKKQDAFYCPFPEIQVIMEDRRIIIKGDDFTYEFGNENILWIHKKMKYVLKIKNK